MPATYEKIATTTLGSAAADITFSSITSAYTDIKVILVATNNAGEYGYFQINGDTGTNYSATKLQGSGSSAGSQRYTSQTFGIFENLNGMSSTLPLFAQLDFFSYAGSTYKTVLTNCANDLNGAGTGGDITLCVNLWRSTSAITSIKLYPRSGNFLTGTTATLYGILKA